MSAGGRVAATALACAAVMGVLVVVLVGSGVERTAVADGSSPPTLGALAPATSSADATTDATTGVQDSATSASGAMAAPDAPEPGAGDQATAGGGETTAGATTGGTTAGAAASPRMGAATGAGAASTPGTASDPADSPLRTAGEQVAASGVAPPRSGSRPLVVAIGDSIMSGHGLDDPSGSWPDLLAAQNGWQLVNLADDGTGFVQPGDADDTFQNQVDIAVQLDPSIVLIAASNNDLGVDGDDLSSATTATMQSLRAALPNARIVALSAFWGDTTPPDELQEATDDVQVAAGAIGATFVDIGQPLDGRPDLMQDDDVHPTAEGQAVLAAAIAADIAAALGG